MVWSGGERGCCSATGQRFLVQLSSDTLGGTSDEPIVAPWEYQPMKLIKALTVLLWATVVSGCTSITVRPIEAKARLKHVCIQENPKVWVADFLPVLRDGLSRHGISSDVYTGAA